MKKVLVFFAILIANCYLLISNCFAAELQFRWETEVSDALPYNANAFQGETFTLDVGLRQYGQDLTGAATATFYYQTKDMAADAWYTVAAEWDEATGRASVDFTPSMDNGASAYRFFFGIETTQGKNYRAYGTLRMKPSPGFNPATLEAPDVYGALVADILESVFAQSDIRYATKQELAELDVEETDPVYLADKPGIEAAISTLQEDLSSVADRSATNTADIATLETQLATKQDALTAGDGIAITDTIISAIGGTLETFGLSGGTDNASVYAWYGNLGMLGIDALQLNAITELSIYKRGGSSPNDDIPLYARILRKDGTSWRVAYQSMNTQTFSMFSAPNARIPFTMRNVDGTPAIPTNEDVAVVFVSMSNAPADAVLAVGARTTGSYRGSVTSDTGGSLPLIPGTQSYGMAMQLIAYVDAPTTWEDITGKPETFTPAEHTHSYNDLTNKPTLATLGGVSKSQMASYINEQGVESNLAPLTRSNALHDASKAEDAIIVRKDDNDPYSGFGSRSISVKNALENGIWNFKGRTVENVSNTGLASYTATTYPNSGGSQAILGAYASTGAQNIAAVEAKATASAATLTLSDTTGTLTLTPTTQWPWSSISGVPSTFTPATHNHDSAYLKLSGGTATGTIAAPILNATTYFVTPKLVNEASNPYNHALNLGYANHDYWEFLEYGGDFRFYKSTGANTQTQVARITTSGIYEGTTLLANKYAAKSHTHTEIATLQSGLATVTSTANTNMGDIFTLQTEAATHAPVSAVTATVDTVTYIWQWDDVAGTFALVPRE